MSAGAADDAGRAAAAADPPLAPRSATALRALGLGVVYAAVVIALLLLGRAGRGFIYQGF